MTLFGMTPVTWGDISAVFSDVLAIAGEVIEYVASHNILVVLLAASMIPIGFGIFKALRHVTGHR